MRDVQIITEPTSMLIDCVCIEQNNDQPNQESNIRIVTNGIIIQSWSMARMFVGWWECDVVSLLIE